MKFKNNGEDVKVRIREESGYRWQTVKSGKIVELPENTGLSHKFEKVIEEPIVSEESKKVPKKTKKKKK